MLRVAEIVDRLSTISSSDKGTTLGRYFHQPSSFDLAKRTGSILFGIVALLAVIFAEVNMMSIPELGVLILLPYGIAVLLSSVFGGALSKWYLDSVLGFPAFLAVPICSLGLGFFLPTLMLLALGDLGFVFHFVLTIGIAFPVIAVGGALASFFMYRTYSRHS